MAISVVKRGAKWETEQVWKNAEVSMYMNSPAISGDYLFSLSHNRKGQFVCLDSRTGLTRWSSNGREGDNAAILSTGQFLLLLTDGADLIVARADPKQFEMLKKYSVAESPTWAHPVVVGKRLLVKDASNLALLGFE